MMNNLFSGKNKGYLSSLVTCGIFFFCNHSAVFSSYDPNEMENDTQVSETLQKKELTEKTIGNMRVILSEIETVTSNISEEDSAVDQDLTNHKLQELGLSMLTILQYTTMDGVPILNVPSN